MVMSTIEFFCYSNLAELKVGEFVRVEDSGCWTFRRERDQQIAYRYSESIVLLFEVCGSECEKIEVCTLMPGNISVVVPNDVSFEKRRFEVMPRLGFWGCSDFGFDVVDVGAGYLVRRIFKADDVKFGGKVSARIPEIKNKLLLLLENEQEQKGGCWSCLGI